MSAGDDSLGDLPLRERLAALAEKTESGAGLRVSGLWMVGDRAGERQVLDDLEAGRVHWAAANRHARYGLEALAEGDRELALACARAATDFYAIALEAKVRPSDLQTLARPAQRRGRRAKN
jgi:hypothetical protein